MVNGPGLPTKKASLPRRDWKRSWSGWGSRDMFDNVLAEARDTFGSCKTYGSGNKGRRLVFDLLSGESFCVSVIPAKIFL